MNEKPNAVLFKTTEQLCIVPIDENGKGDWDSIGSLDISVMKDTFNDLSVENPFEFVYCFNKDNVLTTTGQKTIVPNHSFLTLYVNNLLQKTIETDYYNQYLK